jgi:hypothetical protein
MKKTAILLILLIFLLVGCKSEVVNNAPINQPEQTEPDEPKKPEAPKDEPKPTPESEPEQKTEPIQDPEPTPDPEPEPTIQPFTMASIGAEIKFTDGQNWVISQYEKHAGGGWYMVADELHQIDTVGNVTATVFAPEPGDIVKRTSTGFVICDIMTPEEAAALGALPRTYSQFLHYSDDAQQWTELKHWSLNRWECTDIVETESGHILAQDTVTAWHDLVGSAAAFTANEGGVLVANYDANTRRADFITSQGVTAGVWATNYMSSAKNWIIHAGKYYSHNGYELTPGTGLAESANALDGFQSAPYPVDLPNGETPTMIPVGSDADLNVIYWIECNSGWLVELRTATNQVMVDRRLFVGDGMKMSGLAVAKKIRPLFIDNVIYFNHDSSVLYLDLTTGGSGIYLAEDAYLRGF